MTVFMKVVEKKIKFFFQSRIYIFFVEGKFTNSFMFKAEKKKQTNI